MWNNTALKLAAALVSLAGMSTYAQAGDMSVTMYEMTSEGIGKKIGSIQLEDTSYGLLITPHLTGMDPGLNGLHVHENPGCATANENGHIAPGGAAGGHYDPGGTNRHAGPYGDGHLGDLPNLVVETDRSVSIPVLAHGLS